MTAIPNIGGAVRAALSSGDAIAALETGLSAAESRIANILSAGRIKHIKGRCGAEPLMMPGPCNADQMRKYLIQADLYEQARQKLKNAFAIRPLPAQRERWFRASARWVTVMRQSDCLAWEFTDGRMKTPIFAAPEADAYVQTVFNRGLAIDMGHSGERKRHIDLVQGIPGMPGAVVGSAVSSVVVGGGDMWTAADDSIEWGPWVDYDTIGVYRDCGGAFGSPCPGYPDGKRYHRTLRTSGSIRVEWWRRMLEAYSRYPLADLLAYAWGGYSQYLDENAGKLNMTPAQMRAFAEAKTRADLQVKNRALAGGIAAATALIPALNLAGGVIAAILLAIGEVLPLAQGCMFSFYEFTERVIDEEECGAWGEGRVAADTVPKMYSALIAQGFDPQARLDELNAPPVVEPTTPAWLVPAAAMVGGLVVGAVIAKVVT